MPIKKTYPGVYIQEIPSGVRTIAGVATSITALIGRANRGPVNQAEAVKSYADFERSFGGLDLNSAMSFAVRDFFNNGGNHAVIVRLFNADTGNSTASLSADNVDLEAVSKGQWGNHLQVTVSHDDATTANIAVQQGLAVTDLFNISVKDLKAGISEDHLNVSLVSGPRQLGQVLASASNLVMTPASFALPATRPAVGVYTVEMADQATDGAVLDINDYIGTDNDTAKKGLYALEQVDLFNLLCLPPDWDTVANTSYPAGLLATAATYCEERRRAILLIDPPSDWSDSRIASTGISTGIGTHSENAALYFPRLKQGNPLRNNELEEFVPCGAVAGVCARTDAQRGVWSAPAGTEASLRGVDGLSVRVTNDENGRLNQLAVNCLRSLPNIGPVVWGARTLQGGRQLASEWKYIPVRRTALYIEESLYRGTQWVAFEPNDEPLWAQIRLNVGAFMQDLFRQGAFQGARPNEAYFVKCDRETTTQNDINRSVVNIQIGFAPLKPAEFVIIKIQQRTG